VIGNTLPTKENREKRQIGHLRLLIGQALLVGIKPGECSTNLQPGGKAPETIVTSESFMPKRQQNRSYKDSDPAGGSTARPSTADASDYPNIKREFILTRLADESLFETVRVLSSATGTSLTQSLVLRILLKVIACATPEIEREASKLRGTLKRPGNARENQAEREEYELRLAKAIAAALKSAPPPGLDAGSSQKGSGSGKNPA
jgi:hypothetical protein